MNQRIVFLSHPISGNPEGNVKKLLAIIRHINLTELDVVPFCPYIADALCMRDHDAVERARAIENSNVLIRAGFISECRLYGSHISPGMLAEKELFESLGVEVKDYIKPAVKEPDKMEVRRITGLALGVERACPSCGNYNFYETCTDSYHKFQKSY